MGDAWAQHVACLLATGHVSGAAVSSSTAPTRHGQPLATNRLPRGVAIPTTRELK